jgi:thiol-disulfide isomerase/thioredoxin
MNLKILLMFVLIGLMQTLTAQVKTNGSLAINLFWDKAAEKDTLYLFISNPVHPGRNLFEVRSTLKQGYYHFDVPVSDSTGYFTIKTKASYKNDSTQYMQYALIVKTQFWRLGDQINFHISNHKETGVGAYNDCYFTGKDALRYSVFRQTDSILLNTPEIINNADYYFQNPQEKILAKALDNLKSYKNKLSYRDYQLIASNINFYNGNFIFNQFYERFLKLKNNQGRQCFKKAYANYKAKLNYKKGNASDLINSNLIAFLYNKYCFESKLQKGVLDFNYVFQIINQNENGEIRDRLISKLFLVERRPNNFDQLQKETSKVVQEKYSRDIINQFATQAKGTKLQDFVFLDTADKEIKLSDFKGRIVVIDIWANGCGGCHLLYSDVISKLESQFAKSEVVFFSIGVDRKKNRWLMGIKSGLYTSEDEVNVYTGSQGYDHPLFKENVSSGTPTVIILDKDGSIAKFNTEDLYTEKGLTQAINSIL